MSKKYKFTGSSVFWFSYYKCTCVYICLKIYCGSVIYDWLFLGLNRLYYQHIPEDKEYPVLCRRLATEKKGWAKTVINYLSGGGFEREEILLDWNEIAEQYGWFPSYPFIRKGKSFRFVVFVCTVAVLLPRCLLCARHRLYKRCELYEISHPIGLSSMDIVL